MAHIKLSAAGQERDGEIHVTFRAATLSRFLSQLSHLDDLSPPYPPISLSLSLSLSLSVSVTSWLISVQYLIQPLEGFVRFYSYLPISFVANCEFLSDDDDECISCLRLNITWYNLMPLISNSHHWRLSYDTVHL